MKASQHELFTLKGLLESFAQSTGLRVNYMKSHLAPLNLSDDKAHWPSSWLVSLVGSLNPCLSLIWVCPRHHQAKSRALWFLNEQN
jgi:hypothetical protein